MRSNIKIALFLIIANTLMLVAFGGSLYYFLQNYSYTDFYKRLETRANISARYNYDPDTTNIDSYRMLREKHLEKLTQENEYLYEVNSSEALDDISRSSSFPLPFLKEVYTAGKSTLRRDDILYTGIRYTANRKSYIVVVSARNYYASHHLVFLRNILLVGSLFVFAITTYMSVYFSRHIFDPIKKITGRVKQISTDSFHLRIEETDKDPEISQLVLTINDLLNRLETAFETQKNFISNASHEFGTPLTSIMGMAEVMLKKDRPTEEYKEALQGILDQAERLNQITQSLLFLAQTGYTNKKISFDLLRTDELIWEAKAIVDKLNPGNNIHIDLSLLPESPKKLKINGNRQLLNLAFANILTNACKYSNNKPVSVSIASGSNHVLIVVKDQGIGIPENELQFIYDPFFRASNTSHFEGYGIGLPLARNIIRIHNGQLTVSSRIKEGTTVQIKIPLANIV